MHTHTTQANQLSLLLIWIHSHLLSKLKDHFNWHTLHTHTCKYVRVFVYVHTYVCFYITQWRLCLCVVAFLLARLFLKACGQEKRRGRRGRVDTQTEVRETKIGSNKALKKQMHNRMQIICGSVCAHCLNFNIIRQKCKYIYTYILF